MILLVTSHSAAAGEH